MLVCEKNNDSLWTVEAEIFIDDFNFFIFIFAMFINEIELMRNF